MINNIYLCGKKLFFSYFSRLIFEYCAIWWQWKIFVCFFIECTISHTKRKNPINVKEIPNINSRKKKFTWSNCRIPYSKSMEVHNFIYIQNIVKNVMGGLRLARHKYITKHKHSTHSANAIKRILQSQKAFWYKIKKHEKL